MEVRRGRIGPLLLSIVLVWMWSGVDATTQRCRPQGVQCVFEKFNISAGDMELLRAMTPNIMNLIIVEKLVTPYTDGFLLQQLSSFVDEVVYERYHEAEFRIPPNAPLNVVHLRNAPYLRKLTVPLPNHLLTTLHLEKTGLRVLADGLLNLRNLAYLIVIDSDLETVSLDVFANCPRIVNMILGSNKVSQLLVSRQPDLVVPATDIFLEFNQLEHLHWEFFHPLTNLTYLNLEGNRIQKISGQLRSMPRLIYFNLQNNQLTSLDVSGWIMPKLFSLLLDNNNLTRLPAGLDRLAHIGSVQLAFNMLVSVDFRRFEGMTNLIKIDLSNNRLGNVRVSQSGRVSLPSLMALDLSYNQLRQIEFGRWDFPMLETLTLAFNGFQRIPDLLQSLPGLRRVYLFQNPVLCSTIRRWQRYVEEYKLFFETNTFGIPCSYNATYTLSTGRTLCCVE